MSNPGPYARFNLLHSSRPAKLPKSLSDRSVEICLSLPSCSLADRPCGPGSRSTANRVLVPVGVRDVHPLMLPLTQVIYGLQFTVRILEVPERPTGWLVGTPAQALLRRPLHARCRRRLIT